MAETPPEEMRSTQSRRLRYHEELEPVMDVIYKDYRTLDTKVYRTVCTLPASVFDITPQSKREGVESQGEALAAPMDEKMVTELRNRKIAKKREYISEHSLSVFKTPEQLRVNVIKSYNKIVKNYGLEEANAYLTDRRGKYICRINVNNNGIMNKFSTSGHADLLLYEGVTETDLYDSSFRPIEIIPDDEPNNDNTDARP